MIQRSEQELRERAQDAVLDYAKIKVMRAILQRMAPMALEWDIDFKYLAIWLWLDKNDIPQITIGNRVDDRTFSQEVSIEQYKNEDDEALELFEALLDIMRDVKEFWNTTIENIQCLTYANDDWEIIGIVKPKRGFEANQQLVIAGTPSVRDFDVKSMIN